MNIKQLFLYNPPKNYNFTLNTIQTVENEPSKTSTLVYQNIDSNLKFIKNKFSSEINSDIMIREFSLTAKNKEYKSFIIYIDGMVNSDLINRFVLSPLMLRNSNNTSYDTFIQKTSPSLANSIYVKKVKKFNLETYIYSNLMPQNNLEKLSEFEKIIDSINSGNCALFVDSIPIAFDIDVKGFKQRGVESPSNEIIIKGPQEAFVENIRTNTSLLRRITNNENLIIENLQIGTISKTKVAVCYMKNIANNNLVNEVKYRLNNLSLDSLSSAGQLEQLIEENEEGGIPSLLSTERPDKCSKFLMQGRVIILINGNPYAIIAPVVLIDFLSSPEDTNLKVIFANFLKLLRFLAYFITLLAPRNFYCCYKFSPRNFTY